MTQQTWQHDLFNKLRQDPQEWFCLGVLFEEFKTRIPLHNAMRLVHARYDIENLPSGDKAQWLFLGQVIRQMGVDRADHTHNRWVYSDKVRLKQRGTCPCGGPRIRNAFGSPKLICLTCGLLENAGPKQVVSKIVNKPIVEQGWFKDPIYKPTLVPIPETSPPPDVVVNLPEAIAKEQEEKRPVLTIYKNVRPEEHAAHIAAGGIPIQQLDNETWLAKIKNLTIILYKNRMWTIRSLATYLKDLLPSFSINRLEQELRRCGYRPVLLLQKYNATDNLRNVVVIHNKEVNSFAEFVRAMQGRK